MARVHKFALIIAATGLSTVPCGAQAPLKIESSDASMKFGILAQPMYEAVGSSSREDTSHNVFVRRFRLMLGGTVGENFEYFFETDNPNLGKADTTGAKTTGGLILQDAVITWKAIPGLKLDAGLLLVPGSHHGNQGATTLLTTDYSPYAFLQSSLLGNSNGRDGGVQVRGQFGGLEFRTGVFQGKRLPQTDATPGNPGRVAARNMPRLAGRAQWNFFDAEGGAFLGGTYLGAKRILSVGLAHDRQDDYRSTAADLFIDWPLGKDGVTFQVNHVRWDGGTWIALPKQNTTFAEGAYRFGGVKLAPLVRFDQRRPSQATLALPNETRLGAGLAWWIKGHTTNLKAFYSRVKQDAPGVTTLKDFDQINVQWQVYFF
jgi:hypothetical protein